MEDGSIAQVCKLYNKPSVEIRVISDTSGGEEYENFEHEAAIMCADIVKDFVQNYRA